MVIHLGMVLPRSVPLPGGRTAPPVTVTVTVLPLYLNIGPRLRTYKQPTAMTTIRGQSQPRRDWDSSKSWTVLPIGANDPSAATQPTRTLACNQSARVGLAAAHVRPRGAHNNLLLLTATKPKKETSPAANKKDNWKCRSSNLSKISTAKQQWSKQPERNRANGYEEHCKQYGFDHR